MLRRVFFLLVFALIAPALTMAEGETRIANPANLEIANTMVRSFDRTVPISSDPYTPLVSNLFNAQFTCQKAAFDRAKAELLERLDIGIRYARAESNRAVISSLWDNLLALLVKFRDFVESLEYSECGESRPDPQQAQAIINFRTAVWPVRARGNAGVRPDNVLEQPVEGGYGWTPWPELAEDFENLLIYQRICDKNGFNKQKREIQTSLEGIRKQNVRSETSSGIKQHSDAVKALATLDLINFVPCDEKPKPRTAGLPSSSTTGGAGAGNAPGAGSTQGTGQQPGQGTGSNNAPPAGTGEDEPLPGLDDDDRIGLLDLWRQSEITANVSTALTFDGSDAFYGQFTGNGQPVFDAGDDLDPVCGNVKWTSIYGIPVPVGENVFAPFNDPAGLRLSVAGQFCSGDDDQAFQNFQSGQNFLLGQPNGGTQLINGAINFSEVALSREYDSLNGAISVGSPLFQNGGVLITGEIYGGFRYMETKDIARFTANAINFQSTSTQDVESRSGGIGLTKGLYFSPNGPTVPSTGLQTIFVTGHAGLYVTSADATDTFDTFQTGVFAETQRANLSETEITTAYGVSAGVRLGLGPGVALTLEGFWESMEEPFIHRQVGQPSRLDFRDVDYAGVRGAIVMRTSDARLKRDITPVTTLENGIRIYAFKYLWDDTVHVGVMAQDLLKHEIFRHAVILKPNGFYAVNYKKLGLKMATLEAWREYGLAAVMLTPSLGHQVSSFVPAPAH